ncbi:hypothetical protein [Sphingobacterium multivorum]|uniref:hypothetical protein n=1 Tax=Sphingobacterium multivorum TaxID=28454 RepID=UPI0028A6428B|nr:hypothetical protein [Sphingobacterium multivorum]
MEKSETNNPLYGVTIGSIIYSQSGKFAPSVIRAPISRMIAQQQSEKYMSGESSYLYSERMNQGTFGMSGAYGASGISLLKSSMSAYVGESKAVTDRSVVVNYSAIAIGGVEYVNFEDLTASDLIASLNGACQEGAQAVLTAYNNVIKYAADSKRDIRTALKETDAESLQLKELVNIWVEASEDFAHDFGDGLVVGVIWGGLGGVTMKMTSQSESESWQYGGSADFSYANAVASVAVQATYDGGQSHGKAKVNVTCRSFSWGTVLNEQVKEWLVSVENKSFSELADVSVMEKAPKMEISRGAPTIPEFHKPEVDEEIEKEVEKIENLDDLKEMAEASAYKKTLKTNPKISFDEFINNAEKPANTDKLKNLQEKIKANDIDTLNFLNKSKTKKAHFTDSNLSVPQGALPVGQEVNTEGYVPLGAWISHWSTLFPWMAQGYYNSIDGIEGEEIIRLRVMLQDYLTLSRMYYIAHNVGIVEFKRKDRSLVSVSTLSLGDAFAHAAAQVQEAIETADFDKVEQTYKDLNEATKNVYKLWNEVSFLRSCELGLGLIKDKKTIGPALQNTDQKSVDTRQAYSLIACDFEGKNYTAFSRAYKVLPLLTPDGDILAFGPEQGALSSIYDNEIVFTKPGRTKYLVFSYDKSARELYHQDHQIKLYPVPFSAADNVSAWKGMSLSTNVGSIKGLNLALTSLNDQLEKLQAWSFSSMNWSKKWNGKKLYRQHRIKRQYIGIIDEIKNIFS